MSPQELAAIVARDAAVGSDLPAVSAFAEYQALADRRALLALLRETREAEPLPGETLAGDHSHPLYRPLMLAVRAADEAFEKAGDAGTKTWLDDYFLPELAEHGLTVIDTLPKP